MKIAIKEKVSEELSKIKERKFEKDGFIYEDDSCEILIGFNKSYEFSKEIVLPSTLKVIEDKALSNFKAPLSTMIIPGSVERIGHYAFENVELNTVFFEEGIKKINAQSFTFNRIKNIKLAESIKELEEEASAYSSIENINLENVEIFNCRALARTCIKEATIRNAKELRPEVFLASDVEKITYNSSLSIPTKFCAECSKLKEFTVLKSFDKIGDFAFVITPALTSFNFPEGLMLIEKRAFQNSGIETVTLPNSIDLIANEAFGNCKKLKSFYFPVNPKSNISLGNLLFKNSSLPILNIPPAVNMIEPWSLASSNLEKVIINASIDALPKHFASNSKNLSEIIIENPSIKSLGNSCFSNTGIVEVGEQFKNIEYFGENCFSDCKKLDVAYIYTTVMTQSMFRGCDNLRYAVFLNNMESNIPIINLPRNVKGYMRKSDNTWTASNIESRKEMIQDVEEISEKIMNEMSFRKASKILDKLSEIVNNER